MPKSLREFVQCSTKRLGCGILPQDKAALRPFAAPPGNSLIGSPNSAEAPDLRQQSPLGCLAILRTRRRVKRRCRVRCVPRRDGAQGARCGFERDARQRRGRGATAIGDRGLNLGAPGRIFVLGSSAPGYTGSSARGSRETRRAESAHAQYNDGTPIRPGRARDTPRRRVDAGRLGRGAARPPRSRDTPRAGRSRPPGPGTSVGSTASPPAPRPLEPRAPRVRHPPRFRERATTGDRRPLGLAPRRLSHWQAAAVVRGRRPPQSSLIGKGSIGPSAQTVSSHPEMRASSLWHREQKTES